MFSKFSSENALMSFFEHTEREDPTNATPITLAWWIRQRPDSPGVLAVRPPGDVLQSTGFDRIELVDFRRLLPPLKTNTVNDTLGKLQPKPTYKKN